MKRAITAPNRLSQRNRQKSGAPPMTADGFPNRDVRHGAVFGIERRGPEFFARRISGVAIFPCEGGRDEASEQALAAAFDKGGAVISAAMVFTGDMSKRPRTPCVTGIT